MSGSDLRRRAARWRAAAERTRQRAIVVERLAEVQWQSPAAELFRREIAERGQELREVARRQAAVAPLLERVADLVDSAWSAESLPTLPDVDRPGLPSLPRPEFAPWP